MKRMKTKKAKARQGEVPLGQFVAAEAVRTNVGEYKVRRRMWLGHYRMAKVRFVNKRVAFVRVTGKLPALPQDLRAWRYLQKPWEGT